jgi:hypothetical protein
MIARSNGSGPDDVPAMPSTPLISLGPLVAEVSLALWLVVRGLDETKWREQAGAIVAAR